MPWARDSYTGHIITQTMKGNVIYWTFWCFVIPEQGWANFLTRGPQWVLKLDQRAGTKAWMECLCELIKFKVNIIT